MSITLDLRISFCMQPIELPVFNPIALELLQMLEDPSIEMDAIVKTINADQALSAHVLKMANSSAFAGLARSETIKDSAVRLGTRQITNLVMAASQAAIHKSRHPLIDDIMQELWLHSQACALGCWSLAQNTGHRSQADQAYMGGLLHDIGKLYILKALEEICKTDITFTLSRDLVLDVFSEMHVELGCRLMDHWNIPPVYRSIVASHHLEAADPQDVLLAIVRLVNINSRRLQLSLHRAHSSTTEKLPSEETLPINAETWESLEESMTSVGRIQREGHS